MNAACQVVITEFNARAQFWDGALFKGSVAVNGKFKKTIHTQPEQLVVVVDGIVNGEYEVPSGHYAVFWCDVTSVKGKNAKVQVIDTTGVDKPDEQICALRESLFIHHECLAFGHDRHKGFKKTTYIVSGFIDDQYKQDLVNIVVTRMSNNVLVARGMVLGETTNDYDIIVDPAFPAALLHRELPTAETFDRKYYACRALKFT